MNTCVPSLGRKRDRVTDNVSEKGSAPAGDVGRATAGLGVAPESHRDPLVMRFLERHSHESAVITFTTAQRFRLLIFLVACLVFFAFDWKIFITVLNFVVSGLYFVIILHKLVSVLLSSVASWDVKVSERSVAALADDELPFYTILLPMYKEPEVAQKVISAALSVDYPKDKMEVLLLLEHDDEDTRKALEGVELHPCVKTVIVPEGGPRTKPRACNHGLDVAKGEYLVIYDAEDRPEPDQLKKAVAAFKEQPGRVVCLQAKLNYYNPNQNWLTKWFTMEYSVWFDLFLPGLHALRSPIPLGGTSNHFRTSVLRELGGWDPFNVTEDCDLGIRLYKHGYRTRILDSTTHEEANSRLWNWIRQRSRWVKGYVQTHLVHTRSAPFGLGLIRRLGLWRYLSFLLIVGGLAFVLLLNPVYWVIGALYLAKPWQMWYERYVDEAMTRLDPWSVVSQVFWYVAVGLLIANALFILINVLGCIRRKRYSLLPWALFSPLYWIFMSLAAWKGFFQLFTRAHYWEKTHHGLTDETGATANKKST